MNQEPLEAGPAGDLHAPRVASDPTAGSASEGATMEQGTPEGGWIRDWRVKLEWHWFKHPETAHLFEYLLLRANHAPATIAIGGVKTDLQPGQLVFGRLACKQATGLSVQSIRTGLQRLASDSTILITIHSTKQASIITICNWGLYQSRDDSANQPFNQPFNQASTRLQPGFNQASTTDKNDKKKKKEKKKKDLPPASPTAGKARARNIGWDILVRVFGFPERPAAGQQAAEMGGLAKQFNAFGATEDEAILRFNRLKRWMPDATATVRSLLKHWPELGQPDIEEQIARRNGGNGKGNTSRKADIEAQMQRLRARGQQEQGNGQARGGGHTGGDPQTMAGLATGRLPGGGLDRGCPDAADQPQPGDECDPECLDPGEIPEESYPEGDSDGVQDPF